MMNYMTDKKITLKYIILYTSEHNSIVKCCWCTFYIMKNVMLLNADLFNCFWVEIINIVNYLRNYLFIHERIITSEKVWTEIRSDLSHIRIFEFVLYIHILKEKHIKSDLNQTWKDILVEYMTISKQIKVWSIKTSLIHIVLTYIIDEHSRDVDLLKNEDILLLLLTHTKLQDQIVFDVSHKYDWSQKLIIDNDDVNALKNCTNHKKDSNLSKKTEKNMSASF